MGFLRDGLFNLMPAHSVALTVFALAVVAVLGLAFGSLKFRGISLGIGGVLFSGLLLGQWLGEPALDKHVVEFAREFGLILFVYTIGVQAGPGFLASLRHQGLPLNLMAAAIVLMGAGVAVVICKAGGVPMESAVGLFAGGSTNTPSLAAAGQAMMDTKGFADSSSAVAGYAIAYPFGILGCILVMVLFKSLFKVNLDREAKLLERKNPPAPALQRACLTVTNPNIVGHMILQLPVAGSGEVVISRIRHADGATGVAYPETVIQEGDALLAVGTADAVERLKLVVGEDTAADFAAGDGPIVARNVIVTRKEPLGKTVDELNLDHRFGARVTRVRRASVELAPTPTLRLQFGDTLTVVGSDDSIKSAGELLGNSLKQLNHPQIAAIFFGIALGVLLGSIPIAFPGLPAPVKLGLAGGPLIVALVLSRVGHWRGLVWFIPPSANLALREVGISLFLAAVGIKSGAQFFEILLNGPGLTWMAWGALVTAVPLATVGLIARLWYGLDYMSLCGLVAGSMTDPPALSFAGTVTQSEAPGIAYAAVYPLVMVLRVLAAQVLVLAFV